MDVLVFGAGSLGSLVGGLLAREHDVTLVGRDPHVATVRESGLRISGAVDETVTPDAATEPPAAADLAVVTVKTFDTPAAAAALAECDLDVVLSLQNGMGNEEELATSVSAPVLAGTCTYGARMVEPGHVECTGVGEVVLGAREGGQSDEADSVGVAFDAAGLDVTVATDMPRRLWEKLAVNCGINATTALARVENGALVDGPAGETARAAAREVAQVARDHGVDLSAMQATTAVSGVARTTAANTSSMAQDVQAGARTEIDAINGYVVANATDPVPVNETLTHLVRAWEIGQDLRDDGP
ncbi:MULTISPECIES: ketopantoate reductase family protein [Salinibaculum]|uniref:ketopantoate reductase family protein n=1 Tax=Salinibaculum TaxID=2732368 RepID=UPI0030D50B62